MNTGLQDFRFRKVGEWMLNMNKNGIDFKFFRKSIANERVIYAFTSKNGTHVKYIGICEKRDGYLKQRMDDYKTARTKSTEWKVERIKKQLELGKKVEIWAVKPEISPHPTYIGLRVDLIRGLENQLINKFNPEWNTKDIGIGAKRYGIKILEHNGSRANVILKKRMDYDELIKIQPDIGQRFDEAKRKRKSINLR